MLPLIDPDKPQSASQVDLQACRCACSGCVHQLQMDDHAVHCRLASSSWIVFGRGRCRLRKWPQSFISARDYSQGFGADHEVFECLERMIHKYRIQSVIETHTGDGRSARKMADSRAHVYTIERWAGQYVRGKLLEGFPHVSRYCGNASALLPNLLKRIGSPALFFLEDGWDPHSPLEAELQAIADCHIVDPVIAVRHMNHGYPLSDTVAACLSAIYRGGDQYRLRFFPSWGYCVEPVRNPRPSGFVLLVSMPPQHHPRRQELLSCLNDNLRCSWIDSIVVFDEAAGMDAVTNDKVTCVTGNGRVTFQDMFSYANSFSPGRRCLVANSDIIFDDSLRHLADVDLRDTFVAISRWDEGADGGLNFFGRSDSQDAWAFTSPTPIREAHFYPGLPGCDNFLVYLAKDAGLTVINPGRDVVARHRHHNRADDSWASWPASRITSIGHRTCVLLPIERLSKQYQQRYVRATGKEGEKSEGRVRQAVTRAGVWFVDIPRTSSSSIRVELGDCFGFPYGKTNLLDTRYAGRQGYPDHMTAPEARAMLGDAAWGELFKFSIVRNPWDRVLSVYRYRCRMRDFPDWSFGDYVRRLSEVVLGDKPSGIFAYHGYRYGATDFLVANGQLQVDRVIRYESRKEGLAEIASRIGCPNLGRLKIQSASQDTDAVYVDLYDRRSADLVGEMYADDVQIFGYSFGS